jgi:BirA family biotin operon repressor/biotin-[acetyl-CoA-carboxylase] ligase
VSLGTPRLHLRETTSTNDVARELAIGGAPHGTLVTAGSQTAGRGRQGRAWTMPPGAGLLMSLVLSGRDPLLPLAAAVAVVRACDEPGSTIKWPNDVLLHGRKIAGILAEARPPGNWVVLGIGINVAVDATALPDALRERAGTLGRSPGAVAPLLSRLLSELEQALALPAAELLAAWRSFDALAGRPVRWADGEGVARGVDDEGRLVVELADRSRTALDAGEVHLR